MEVGKVRDALTGATQKRASHIWGANRDTTQWVLLEQKKLFAMSSSCDNKEYHPPIKRISTSIPLALIHLADTNNQLPESQIKAQIDRFENFVKSLEKRETSFDEFRNSETYQNFLREDELPGSSGLQGRSTPTVDEYDDYTEEELGVPYRKRNRLY